MALFFLPLLGLVAGAIIMTAGTLVNALFEKGDEWSKEYGEVKTLYVVNLIIGSAVALIIYFTTGAYS